MNFLEYYPYIISTGALIMSIAVYFRADKWRDSEEAKKLDGRISTVETQVAKHAVKFENIATKEDVARLEADIRGFEKTVKAEMNGLSKEISGVDAGVNRIESYLMVQQK